jgi:hypothetical protein
MSKNGKDLQKLYLPETPPFGLTVLFGRKGMGKTLAAINSPWTPVHVIDVEGSSLDYFNEQDKLIEMGILAHKFTRADCPTFEQFNNEMVRLKSSPIKYGTLVLDTGGQFAEWVRDEIFGKNQDKVEKQIQIVWGKVRDRLRGGVLLMQAHSKLVVVTAHERDYRGVLTPRLNPAVIELASLSVRLVRDPNKPLPDGYISGARLPYFPPRIQAFKLASLLQYFDLPADWDNLPEEQRQPEPLPVLPGAEEEIDG